MNRVDTSDNVAAPGEHFTSVQMNFDGRQGSIRNLSQLRKKMKRCIYDSVALIQECNTITSTAAIFLSNDHSLYAPITSDGCHACGALPTRLPGL